MYAKTVVRSCVRVLSGRLTVINSLWRRPGDNYVKCLPVEYGAVACEPHDKIHGSNFGQGSICNGTGTASPVWCAMSWCWVDPEKCTTRPHALATSAVRFNGVSLNRTHRVAYSYHTCGYVDKYAGTSDVTNAFAGRTFRVSVPHVASPTAHLRSGGRASNLTAARPAPTRPRGCVHPSEARPGQGFHDFYSFPHASFTAAATDSCGLTKYKKIYLKNCIPHLYCLIVCHRLID